MRNNKSKFKNRSLYFLILFLVFSFCALKLISRSALASSSANFQIEIMPNPQCYDGQDNDSDGKIDYPDDPGCSSQSDDEETDPSPEPSCGDGSCNGSETCSSCPTDCGSCGDGEGYASPTPTKKPEPEPTPALPTGDCNTDGLINFRDLSIILWWFDKTPSAGQCSDLNTDGKVTYVDVSILLYRWDNTG